MFHTGLETVSCTIINYLSVSFGFLSAYLSIAIAVNRCITVCLPLTVSTKVFSMKVTVVYCIILWLLAFGQNSKTFFETNVNIFNGYQRRCMGKYAISGYNFTPLLSQLGTAFVVLIFYFVIVLYVKKYLVKVHATVGVSYYLPEALKITKITFLLFACYIVLLIPSSMLMALDPNGQLHPVYFSVAYFICMLDPLVTIMTYTGLNKEIRNVIWYYVSCNSGSNQVIIMNRICKRKNKVFQANIDGKKV